MEHPFHRFVGGRPCLDFVNTVQGRADGARMAARDYRSRVIGERLDSYEALLRWASLVGVLTEKERAGLTRLAARRPGDAAAVLARARRLREAIYRLFKASLEGWAPRPGDLARLNTELQQARARERLVASPRFAWAWEGDHASLDRVLWPVAASAADLLTSPDLERVGRCPGEQCGWLFLDTSRSGRRQWCHMGDCGTLAKVRRFRQRQQSGPAETGRI